MNIDPASPPVSFVRDYLAGQGIAARDIGCTPLAGDGSDRALYRIVYPGNSVILAVNEHPPSNDRGVNENDSFAYVCNHLRSKGFAAPAIHAVHKEQGWFILEDLGDVHLRDHALMLKDDPAQLEELYRRVLTVLPLMQVKAAEGFDAGRIHSPPYDKPFVRRWESGYFLHYFVERYCHCAARTTPLEAELDELAEMLSAVQGGFFLYRDFQSKNIMITRGALRLIDFQGARLGPLHYDPASLLLDPYVALTDEMQEKLLEYYLEQLGKLRPVVRSTFINDYRIIALHRTMQMLGAFAFLSLVKGKTCFTSFIPVAVKSLKKLLRHPSFAPYSTLQKLVEKLWGHRS
jgi:hypothetical protein